MTKKRPELDDSTSRAWARLVAETGTASHRAPSVAEQLNYNKREDPKVDGRSLRKTGRTEQFNVRLRVETKQHIQDVAEANKWLIAEVIERALAALDEKLKRPA